jgi:hypothetical protein
MDIMSYQAEFSLYLLSTIIQFCGSDWGPLIGINSLIQLYSFIVFYLKVGIFVACQCTSIGNGVWISVFLFFTR